MSNRITSLLAAALFAAATSSVPAQIIAQWTFNSGNDASSATGTTSPAVGTGTITTIGGVTQPSFNSGTGSSDPEASDNSGYQTTTYPAQSAGNGTGGIRVLTSTVGFQDIVVTFDLRLSNTSSRWYQFRYTTNGTDFVNFGTPVRLGATENAGDTWFNVNTADLSGISAVENNASFGFEIVSAFSPVAFTQVSGGVNFDANTAYEVARDNGSSAYASSGTWRFDMVTVGVIPEPSTYAAMVAGAGLIVALIRRRRA